MANNLTTQIGAGWPVVIYAALAALFGLAIGSFLNVVIHRIPRGESIVFPGSHCPSCNTPIRAIDNIPLLSYALLGGRCRNCRARIPALYPIVELITSIYFVVLLLKTGPGWESILEMVFASAMIALIFIDAKHRILPNVITYPALLFALAAATVRAGWGDRPAFSFDLSIFIGDFNSDISATRAALIGGLILASAVPIFRFIDRLDLILYNKYFEWAEMNEEVDKTDEHADEQTDEAAERRYRRVINATTLFGVIAAIVWVVFVLLSSHENLDTINQADAYGGLLGAGTAAVIGGGLIWWLRAVYFYIRGMEGMGLGDVKMMAIAGAFLGWKGLIGVLLLGSILGAAVGLILAFRSGSGLKTSLPFGVCLGIAVLVVMVTSTPLYDWYAKP